LEENFDRFNFAIHKEKEMADLRRWITALAVLALFAGLASAQVGTNGGTQLICSVNTSATPTLRSEGITEQIGDIVITCTGGAVVNDIGNGGAATNPAATQVNITVSLTSQVTSRLLGTGGITNASEALLFIDEPNSGLAAPVNNFGPAAPFIVCQTPSTGCGAFVQTLGAAPNQFQVAVGSGTQTVANAAPAANVYQGVVSGNQVTFFGVPVVPPGTNGSRVFRITNIRTNANGIGGGSASGSVPVQASLLTSNFAALPISNATPIVGFVQSSLSTAVGNPTAFGQCNSQTRSFATTLTFNELFGSAWKTRLDPTVAGQTGQTFTGASPGQNKPGTFYNSESGFTLNASTLGAGGQPTTGGFATTAGLADFGTRFKAVFNNLPAGARVFVSQNNTAAGGQFTAGNSTIGFPVTFAQAVTGETVADTTGLPLATALSGLGSTAIVPGVAVTAPGFAAGGVNLVEITPSSGNTATAVWEIVNTNPNQLESVSFSVFVTYTASPGTNSPAPGISTVNLSYAPTSTVTTASATAPIPRFIDTSTAKNAVNIAICRTVLLFPFVTNQLGFDTGLAISNTSTDPFGTTPQAGTCSLNFYGNSAPAAVTTASVASATTYVNLASVIAPGFQGYMIAVCGFQYAHGFAFVSDVGARNVAMGYLALIIPDPSLIPGATTQNRTSTVNVCVGGGVAGCLTNTGEQLAQ
jgi:hypothetical protein